MLRTGCCVAIMAAIWTAPATAGTVTLTFDDLPIFGTHVSTAEDERITHRLLDGFKRHRWRVIGFVNEIQLNARDREARIGLLRQWLDAGMDLGNHSYSHMSLTHTPVETYIADVARGDAVTKVLLAQHGRKDRWYRYPYLETGPTLAIRHTFETWLAGHGYRVAPVTMENSDWQFAEPYDDALAHDRPEEAARIRRAYIDFTARIVPWYQQASQALLGRQIAFVFLLHASRLNADSIDELADILHRQKLKSVTLDKAMKDKAYRIADNYAGPDGDEWLTRWSETLHKNLPYGDLPEVPADIAALDAKLEAAPSPAK
jgi:peptidoglycan/xylan/chitin deacetylase (PgdA/CDA1 family)